MHHTPIETAGRKAGIERARHLLGRASFGATPAELAEAAGQPIRQIVHNLIRADALPDDLRIVEPGNDATKRQLKGMFRNGQLDKEEFRQRIRTNAEHVRNLNGQWLDRMAAGSLREKMALFWHGHFACRTGGQNALFMQQYANTLRRHALGRFSDLLMAVSKEPAMLQFLNNQQNRKGAPNENFAREVMELFTLGRSASGQGNYTEQDVKEAARAFTGWQFTPEGQFVFRERVHDEGSKRLFGETGAFRGEDVVAMLLANRQTARFVTGKIYRFFVADDSVEEANASKRIDELARGFYDSGYDIARLMESIFTSDWFYDARNVGVRIKSPVELLAGMRHTLGVTFDQPQPQLFIQRTLGQILFYPPNVAGWPGGKNWIDSSSLLFRMQLPSYVLKAADVPTRPKEDGDVNTQALAAKGGRQFRTTVNWAAFEQRFAKTPEVDLPDALATVLLPFPLQNDQRTAVVKQAGTEPSQSGRIRALTVALMSLPEYQLC